MLSILYSQAFLKNLYKLPDSIQEDAICKIELLVDLENHQRLKVHKLHGRFSDQYSFSVNFRYRAMFHYVDKSTILLTAIGDHSIYD